MSLTPEKPQLISLEQSRHVAMMKLVRTLRNHFEGLGFSDQYMIALVASVGLAHRGVLPEVLADTSLAAFVAAYSEEIGAVSAGLDRTKFGRTSVVLLETIDWSQFDSFIEENQNRLIKMLAHFDDSAGLDNPLATGWMQQCLIKNSHLNKNVDDGHRTRAGLEDLGKLTQWFTPDWIASFLIDQTLPANFNGTFLDPACGAGHLLVPALEKLFTGDAQSTGAAQRRRAPQRISIDTTDRASERLSRIFDQQLFGIDIDAQLTSLAKFALYLKARSLTEIIELPDSHVIVLDESEQQRGTGSLTLIGKQPNNRLPKQFDAIAMNPPYLGHRIMPEKVRGYLKKNYPHSQYDLCAAFLELGIQMLSPGSRLAAICQQSVLSIQRYEKLREFFLEHSELESVVQLGAGAFATKGGEKTNSAIITFKKRGETESSHVRCWRLLTKADKIKAELNGIESVAHRTINRSEASRIACQLPSSPYAYWAPNHVLQLFDKYPPLSDSSTGVTCTNGLFTCNNEKFVKRFDQVKPEEKGEFVSYDKGGGYKWFRTTDLMLHWKGDGEEIRQYRVKRGQSAKLPGEAHYFKTGITYSYIGTRGFKARLLSPDSVFDIASSAIFSERVDALYILGLLNASLTRCILGVLNPTVNFQIGDIRRLPFKKPTADVESAVANLVTEAIQLAKEVERRDPKSPTYSMADRSAANMMNLKQLAAWSKQERLIQAQIDQLIFDMHELSQPVRAEILADPWVQNGAEAFPAALSTNCSILD